MGIAIEVCQEKMLLFIIHNHHHHLFFYYYSGHPVAIVGLYINYSGFRCPARLHQNINFFFYRSLDIFKSIGNTNTRFDILVICVMSSTQGFQKKTLYSPAMYPIVYSCYIHTNTFIKFNRNNNKHWILPSEKRLRFFLV